LSKPDAPSLASLPPLAKKRITAARKAALRMGVPLYLVGGAVRDLLLHRPVADLDLAVEGDAVRLAAALARDLHARPRVHQRFGTATLKLADGSRLDFASTREESYESSGALPRVAPAPLARDLARRDFTVNAMAIRIAPGRMALLDPFGGSADLARRRIRMLHAGSPHDDPTRAFRAVRYANRLGFSIEAATRDWIEEAVRSGSFDAVSGDRLRRELRLLFSEENRARAVRLMSRLGLDRVIASGISSGEGAIRSFRRAERIASRHTGTTGWLLYLLVWIAGLEDDGAGTVARRLSLAGEERRRVVDWPSSLAGLRREASQTAPSHAASSGFTRAAQRRAASQSRTGDELAAAAALLDGSRGRRLERVLASRSTVLSIRGRDLLAAGVPAGPRVGRALGATLDARRDGRISREEELEFAVAEAREAP
jgi:tRNA nucleotidyltransferase (CCA-adding enzyme)